MKVIKVEPKDIYITFEISLVDAKKILKAVEAAAPLNYDGSDAEVSEAMSYFESGFYEALQHVVMEVDHGT